MTTNSDVTIFNLRVGADRREKFYATESWEFLGTGQKDSRFRIITVKRLRNAWSEYRSMQLRKVESSI